MVDIFQYYFWNWKFIVRTDFKKYFFEKTMANQIKTAIAKKILRLSWMISQIKVRKRI